MCISCLRPHLSSLLRSTTFAQEFCQLSCGTIRGGGARQTWHLKTPVKEMALLYDRAISQATERPVYRDDTFVQTLRTLSRAAPRRAAHCVCAVVTTSVQSKGRNVIPHCAVGWCLTNSDSSLCLHTWRAERRPHY
jgi:hypothetical protein